MRAAVAAGRRGAHGARAGSGRSAPPRPRRAGLASFEQPQFGRRVEAVAGLDLDRRAAAGHQRVEAAAALLEQLVVGCRRGALRPSRRCRRRPWRSPHSSRRRGASHARRRGCRRTRGGCGSRSGPGVTQAPPSAIDFLGAEAGELGALADADDLAVVDADRAIVDQRRADCPAAPRASRCCSRRAGGPTCAFALGERGC